MQEFLLSVIAGRRDIPKKFAHIYERLRSCGAISTHNARFMLAPMFMIARIKHYHGGIFAHNITSPKDKGVRLAHTRRFNVRDGDIVLVLLKPKIPQLITVLFAQHHFTSPRLLCLIEHRGKILARDCKSLESITLPFSQKSLRALPKNCVLLYDGKRITQILGSLLNPLIDEHMILASMRRATSFSQQAIDIARSFDKPIMECYFHRRDLRALEFITIDPSDAKDHDDAIFFDNKTYTLYIAIADVSEYVPLHSALDEEAKALGFSLYFPHICYPMLPQHLSQDLCSLRAHEQKLALVWEVRLHHQTHMPISALLYEAVMMPYRNYSYEEAQGLLESSPTSWLAALSRIAKSLKKKRLQKGFDFLSIEKTMLLDAHGTLIDIQMHKATDSHALIEESMLLANVLSAEILADALHDRGIYRAHEEPSLERLRALFVALNIKKPRINTLHKALQMLQEQASLKGIDERAKLDGMIIKAQKEARYTDKKAKHFGLGFEAYTHFTSPIRRYSDIIAHRLLKELLRANNGMLAWKKPCIFAPKTRKKLAYILESSKPIIALLNDKERAIARAEMMFYDRKYARFAQRHQGAYVVVRILDTRSITYGVIESSPIALLQGVRVVIKTRLKLMRDEVHEGRIASVDVLTARIIVALCST